MPLRRARSAVTSRAAGRGAVRFAPPLARGVLLRRYKRFLADVETTPAGGTRRRRLTMHCANTGAMTGCAEPGSPVWYSTAANPRRKYAHTLELVRDQGGYLIGVNTARANGVVAEAVAAGLLPGLPRSAGIEREVAIAKALAGAHGRFDLRVDGTFVEVKAVTLQVPGGVAGAGAFPDAVSVRATRHLHALTRVAKGGGRAALVFCVLHGGIRSVRPADEIDPAYGVALRAGMAAGVRVWALACRVSPRGITPQGLVPVIC